MVDDIPDRVDALDLDPLTGPEEIETEDHPDDAATDAILRNLPYGPRRTKIVEAELEPVAEGAAEGAVVTRAAAPRVRRIVPAAAGLAVIFVAAALGLTLGLVGTSHPAPGHNTAGGAADPGAQGAMVLQTAPAGAPATTGSGHPATARATTTTVPSAGAPPAPAGGGPVRAGTAPVPVTTTPWTLPSAFLALFSPRPRVSVTARVYPTRTAVPVPTASASPTAVTSPGPPPGHPHG